MCTKLTFTGEGTICFPILSLHPTARNWLEAGKGEGKSFLKFSKDYLAGLVIILRYLGTEDNPLQKQTLFVMQSKEFPAFWEV